MSMHTPSSSKQMPPQSKQPLFKELIAANHYFIHSKSYNINQGHHSPNNNGYDTPPLDPNEDNIGYSSISLYGRSKCNY